MSLGRTVPVQNILVSSPESDVRFELPHDVAHEGTGDRVVEGDDAVRTFGEIQNILNGQCECNDRRFVVLASPEIDISVRVLLYFPASIEYPVVIRVRSVERVHQEEEQVRQVQLSPYQVNRPVLRRLVI